MDRLDGPRSDLMAWAETDPNGLLSQIAGLPSADDEHLTELVGAAREAPDYDPPIDDLLVRELSYTAPALHASA
jgi:hypothetical protein